MLVGIVNRQAGPTVLLTQRTAHLKKHAGQISFPGGGWEERDPHLEATALRETEEEIGLHPQDIEVLGQLSLYETSTAYGVTPIVGWVEPPLKLVADPFEVAEVFEVPLGWIMDRGNHRQESRGRNGRHDDPAASDYSSANLFRLAGRLWHRQDAGMGGERAVDFIGHYRVGIGGTHPRHLADHGWRAAGQ